MQGKVGMFRDSPQFDAHFGVVLVREFNYSALLLGK